MHQLQWSTTVYGRSTDAAAAAAALMAANISGCTAAAVDTTPFASLLFIGI